MRDDRKSLKGREKRRCGRETESAQSEKDMIAYDIELGLTVQ